MERVRANFDRYSVSETGDIYDKKYQRYSKSFKSNKYLQCRLVDNEGQIHIMGVHVAVAMFHSPDYYPGCVVHHKDENTLHNDIANLECLDRSEHSAKHADSERLANYIRVQGPWNKGKKMSIEFCQKCSDSAKRRHRK